MFGIPLGWIGHIGSIAVRILQEVWFILGGI